MAHDIVVVDGARTAIGTFGGSLAGVPPTALAVNKRLELDPEKVNPNGGAIALGHPIGATGAILVVKALAELERVAGKRALVTMCIGGGQGIALAFEKA